MRRNGLVDGRGREVREGLGKSEFVIVVVREGGEGTRQGGLEKKKIMAIQGTITVSKDGDDFVGVRSMVPWVGSEMVAT